MTDGISTENVNMQEYSSNYYDMVARPEIKKKKIYRRVFIRRETKMKIELHQIPIRELLEGYKDNEYNGVSTQWTGKELGKESNAAGLKFLCFNEVITLLSALMIEKEFLCFVLFEIVFCSLAIWKYFCRKAVLILKGE